MKWLKLRESIQATRYMKFIVVTCNIPYNENWNIYLPKVVTQNFFNLMISFTPHHAHNERNNLESLTIREQHRADYAATRPLNHYPVLFSSPCSKSPHFLCHTWGVSLLQRGKLLHPSPLRTPSQTPKRYDYLNDKNEIVIWTKKKNH